MSEPECQQCGDCCNKLGFVEFDYHDVLREPKLTDEFWHGVSKGRDPWSITGVLMFPCQFFDKAKKLCTIYPTRPYQCVTFMPGCEQAQKKGFRCAKV